MLFLLQFFIIESISLVIEYMSTAKGGKGGVVVTDTASLTCEQGIEEGFEYLGFDS